MYPTIHIPIFGCAVDFETLISDSNGTFQIEHPTDVDKQTNSKVKFVYAAKRKDEVNNYHMTEVRYYYELYNEARLEIFKQAKLELEEQLYNINKIISNIEKSIPEEKAKLERKKKKEKKKELVSA